MRSPLKRIKNNSVQTAPKRGGFTLTEAIVASGLLLIAIVPVLKALTIAHLHTAIIERRTRSLNIVQTKLDEVRAKSLYSYSMDFSKTYTAPEPYICVVSDPDYESDSGGLREITVQAGCDIDASGSLSPGEILVTLKTLITRRWNDG